MPKLGETVRDKITGFEGVVVGVARYLTGCNQSCVQPEGQADGKFPESRWLDDQRLIVDGRKEVVTLENGATPGCDVAPPACP